MPLPLGHSPFSLAASYKPLYISELALDIGMDTYLFTNYDDDDDDDDDDIFVPLRLFILLYYRKPTIFTMRYLFGLF